MLCEDQEPPGGRLLYHLPNTSNGMIQTPLLPKPEILLLHLQDWQGCLDLQRTNWLLLHLICAKLSSFLDEAYAKFPPGSSVRSISKGSLLSAAANASDMPEPCLCPGICIGVVCLWACCCNTSRSGVLRARALVDACLLCRRLSRKKPLPQRVL